MESEEERVRKRLEDRTYRQLQQMAKSLSLPSNFKKIYLIELIIAKKFKSDLEVLSIINRVRQERTHLSKLKKKSQISESTNSMDSSPPITVTPKRPSDIDVQYSPEILRKAIMPINPKRNLLRNITETQNTSNITVSSSDRVLRSYNLKTVKPNYALINNNIQELKTQCCATERNFKIIANRGFPNFNVRAACYVKKNRNMLADNSGSVLKRQYNMITNGGGIFKQSPVKRQRRLSGIYPLHPEEIVPRNLTTSQSVCLRKTDGSYTKINALVQKCNMKKNNYKTNPEKKLQDIIDNIDVGMPEDLSMENNNYLKIQYPNTSGFDTTSSDSNGHSQITINHNYKENELSSDSQSVEYENKIRVMHLKYQNVWDMERQQLPKINDAFTRFSNMHCRDPTQPLYAQVSTEIENVPNYLNYMNLSNSHAMLEPIYNIRTNAQLQQTKTAKTECVYTTRTISTASLLPSTAAPSNDALNVTSCDNQYTFDSDMRLQDFLQIQPTMRRNFALNPDFSSSSSIDTMDTSASIPEMVDDALEIISQDGDYMERMGMNMQIQCVFCSWAGPKIILESHIRKEHPDSIHKQCKTEWNITYTLESLVECRVWLHRVIEHDSMLYMLSAKYEDPGCFMATLTSLSTEPQPSEKTVSITIYNKVTGEPFSWTGQIPALPPNMCENGAKCLNIDLSKLDLLPNSANLKLVNRELVTESPNKVVVGHPSLNDIHIIVFVRIFN